MNREHIMAVLYDLTMVIGGEVRVRPLLSRTLQRLLYHTSFPAGLVSLDLPPADGAATVTARLDAAVGDYALADRVGQRIELPTELLLGPPALVEDATLLGRLPCARRDYGVGLRLPIDGCGVILLLATQVPHTELPLTRVFQPVLANLAKAILLCRHNEAYTAGLASERDAAKARLGESERRFQLLGNAAPDAIVMLDERGAIAYWNPAAERMFGYAGDEVLGQDLHGLIVPERDREAFARGFEGFRDSGTGPVVGRTSEVDGLRKDGTELPVDLSVAALRYRGAWHAIGILRDVSERRQAETALRKANRALKTLSACNAALVRLTCEDELLHEICSLIVTLGGHRLAWVGYLDEERPQALRRAAAAGDDCRYLAELRLSLDAQDPHGQGPGGRAIRSGLPQLVRDVAADPSFRPWREAAERCGIGSVIALPLIGAGHRAFGVLVVYSQSADAFDGEERDLLAELAADLAFGIRSLRTHRERERLEEAQLASAERLQRALNGTIQAMAQTVEMRDPYTAGHQQRVARLTAAMARELGWPEERVEGVRLGASIHDIGKIRVPAEILSRPGVLSPVEMALIRTHPEAGFEVLRDVEFPWPVAQMILQHHERLDGSGYPQGLNDGDIMEEARLLAVADVVESMASHRPYRPALGIEVAFAEIRDKRGRLYDPAAVDACIRVFRERGFVLE